MNIHPCARTCAAGRELLVRRVIEEAWCVADAASAAGVSRRTAYKWLKRFRDEGAAGLVDRRSTPHRSPTRLASKSEDTVLELRRTKRMTAAQIAAALRLARSTVARLLKRNGIGRLRLLEPKLEPRRYEWPKPGDMLHIDVKKLGRIGRPGHRARRPPHPRVRHRLGVCARRDR